MKKFWRLFAVVLVLMLIVTACAPAVQGLVALPDEARLLILAAVGAGVTWLLLKLSEVTRIDLKGYAEPVAAALAPILIILLESWLQLIPPVFDNLVLSLIHLLVLLVGSLGAFFLLIKRKAPSIR